MRQRIGSSYELVLAPVKSRKRFGLQGR